MIKRISRKRSLLVVPPCIAALCGFLVIYSPKTFIVCTDAKIRPSTLAYTAAPILFTALFLTINHELSLLGFRKKSPVIVALSLVFSLNVMIMIVMGVLMIVNNSYSVEQNLLIAYIGFSSFILFVLLYIGMEVLRFLQKKSDISGNSRK